MNPEITRQRQLVDSILAQVKEVNDINRRLIQTDPQFVTDIIVAIGQHRHTFEEQGAADHKDCISYVSANGSDIGIRGLLLTFAIHLTGAREAILDVANALNKAK